MSTDQSANLALSFLAPAQAQKHVTVNESLLRLDALVQLCVVSATITAQPGSPEDGAVYILPAGKTGAAWDAMANGALAYFRDGAWEQITPREGWIAYVRDSDQLRVYGGAAWTQSAARAGLGLGTAATLNTGTSGATIPLLNGANMPGGNWVWPQFWLENLAGPLNDKDYLFTVNTSGALLLLGVNDARTAFPTFMEFQRSGGIATGVAFGSMLRSTGDNVHNLGTASNRWATVFAGAGTINTSDAREKTPLQPIPNSVKRAVRRVVAQVGVFQWLDAVARKGEASARLHIGVTAQTVRDAFIAEGEDPIRWALFCEDSLVERVQIEPAQYDDDGNLLATPHYEERPLQDAHGNPKTRLGVRADQLMWLAIAAMAGD